MNDSIFEGGLYLITYCPECHQKTCIAFIPQNSQLQIPCICKCSNCGFEMNTDILLSFCKLKIKFKMIRGE